MCLYPISTQCGDLNKAQATKLYHCSSQGTRGVERAPINKKQLSVKLPWLDRVGACNLLCEMTAHLNCQAYT